MITKDDTILITGGSGFIGTNLIEFFETKKYGKIINFDKAPPTKKQQSDYWFKGNIMNTENLSDVFEKYNPNIIIHLAARTDTLSDVLEDYIENYKGSENVISEIMRHNYVKHVIITSTQYVYKSKTIPLPAKDNTYAPHTTYGISKMMDEEMTRNSGMMCPWTIIRPCNVWGPWHMRYPEELWKIIGKGYYIHPTKNPVIRTYAYVKNLVYQLDQILNADLDIVNHSTFYLGDVPIDSYMLFNEISNQLNNKSARIFPKLIFYLGAKTGDVLRKVGVKFPLYTVRYKNMIEDFYAPSNITVNLFGVRNSNLADNVKETIDWLYGEGNDFFVYWKKRKISKISF
ncbi:NAD(P)-dependent oxidoreductase [uncultured Bacteroides sp.]|uniref:NAD-dependent epimerase/dehydratase family protein n=1 Tax=uncultured Bacteroides sp. TaxID=162156 RepID=UPI002AAB5608|nr:NAD(P)-dependent oxidoreductase [uncultured Bacteroides sp.]